MGGDLPEDVKVVPGDEVGKQGPYRIEIIPAGVPAGTAEILNRFASEGWRVKSTHLMRIPMGPQPSLVSPNGAPVQVMDVLWVLLEKMAEVGRYDASKEKKDEKCKHLNW